MQVSGSTQSPTIQTLFQAIVSTGNESHLTIDETQDAIRIMQEARQGNIGGVTQYDIHFAQAAVQTLVKQKDELEGYVDLLCKRIKQNIEKAQDPEEFFKEISELEKNLTKTQTMLLRACIAQGCYVGIFDTLQRNDIDLEERRDTSSKYLICLARVKDFDDDFADAACKLLDDPLEISPLRDLTQEHIRTNCPIIYAFARACKDNQEKL